MEKTLIKEIERIVLIVAVPLAILLLGIFINKPVIPIAFLIGIFLGMFRLKTLFNYLIYVLDANTPHKNNFYLLIYILGLLLSLGVMGLALYKSMSIGLALVFGIIVVPVIIMFYAIWHGLSLHRKN